MTDEQMKALVKFARLNKLYWIDYFNLFKMHTLELRAEIWHNTYKYLIQLDPIKHKEIIDKDCPHILKALDRNKTQLQWNQDNDDNFIQPFSSYATAHLFRPVASNNTSNSDHIIIKTILEYYGEDFETFEALYL